jgi:hypothetical protein
MTLMRAVFRGMTPDIGKPAAPASPLTSGPFVTYDIGLRRLGIAQGGAHVL